MSNVSGGSTHVPFGDGNHIPPEQITTDTDLMSDTTVQTAMKNIFLACDTDNNNSARVSDLINYMSPHMQEHISALVLLRKALDPTDTNPRVDSETFFKAMIEWTSRFVEQPVELVGNVHSPTSRGPNKMDERDLLYVPSPSKGGVGQGSAKGCTESGVLNLSNSSSYSCTNNGADASTLQERINELEHQNRKLTEELQHCRSQLANSEEQNEALQVDLQKITRRLLSEQHITGQLEKDRHSNEELFEASVAAQKQIGKLEKDLASAEKQVSKLKQHIQDLEAENQKFEEKIGQLKEREGDSKKLIQKMQTEMDIKEQEIAVLEETNSQMKSKLNEQQQIVTHYANVNKCLKEEKKQLEKCYQTIKTQSLTSHYRSASKSFSEYSSSSKSDIFKHPSILNPNKQSTLPQHENQPASVSTPPASKEYQFQSPLTKFYKNRGFFNSPRLLRMVANPVSPHLDSSIITSSTSCKQSVDSDDSPGFLCGKDEAKPVFIDIASTPERSKCAEKSIIDQTPPSVVRKLRVLTPIHENQQYQHKLPTKKRDMSLFSQYRFVGSSSSDDEEINCQTAKHRESNTNSDSQTQQEHNINWNTVTHTEEHQSHSQQEDDTNSNRIHTEDQQATYSLPSNDSEEKEASLPTMYVVERTTLRSKCKSASSGSPVNKVLDSSVEDDPVYWKPVNISPHESLETEISQAKLLENENSELKSTIEHLLKENDQLKSQILNKDNKGMNYSPEKMQHICEVECKALKIKVQELESDNNHKYIKIIDLIQEKERLQRELKRVTGKDTDEINKLKQNILELHHEKGRLLQELEQAKWEKQNSEAIVKHLQSVKNECDLLQNLLRQSKQNGDELNIQFEKISVENRELRTKIEKLNKSLCESNGENSELSVKLQKLTEEYSKLKSNVKAITTDEVGLIATWNEMNAQLSKLVKENEKLKHEHRALTFDRETSTTKLYEKKCENEKLAENTRELSETNKELMQKLKIKEQEQEYLRIQLDNLEEANKRMVADLILINGDYKNMKDSQNNFLKEHESLLAEKESLVKTNLQLANDYKEIKDLKEKVERQLCSIKNEKDELAKQNKTLTKAMEESHRSLHSAQAEVTNLLSKMNMIKETHCYDRSAKDLPIIQEKISELENTNKMLRSENEKLQEDFNAMRGSYESLANEQESWFIEKSEWLQLKEEFSKKLMSAMAESQCLEEQLRKQETFKMDESFCSNCVVLKTEIEDLNGRIKELHCKVVSLELQDQTPTKNQGRSYDRMQLKIEKLQAEVENEKQKSNLLESINSKLQAEVQENLNRHKEEKTNMLTKSINTSENVMKLQRELHEMEQEKRSISKDCEILKEKLDAAIKEKEIRLKSTNKEKNQLKQEIQDLVKQKAGLEKKLETSQNLLKCKLNVDKVNKENSQLKQEIEELNDQKVDYEKQLEEIEHELKDKLSSEQKLKDHLESIAKENLTLKQQIEELDRQNADLGNQLEKSHRDLQRAETKNLSIRKELTDIQSACDYVGIKNSEYESVENLVKEKDSLQKLLKNCENDISSLSEHVKIVNEKLVEKRKRLHRSTLTAVNNWRETLKSIPDKRALLESFDKGEPATSPQKSSGPLDEEMLKFNYQINFTSLVLETFGTLKTSSVRATPSRDVEIQATYAVASPPSPTQKYFKESGFKVESPRSVSPDSPSINFESSNTDISLIKKKFTSVKKGGSNSSISLDSGVSPQDSVSVGENSLEASEEVIRGPYSNKQLFEIASPSFSDSTLENLGLLYEDESPKWTKKEVEEKFTILVACFMVDVATYKDRSKQQEICHGKIENKCSVEVEKLMASLTNIKKLGKDHQIDKLVSTCIRQVKLIIGMFFQSSTSAMQYGALQHEERFLKVINVMINHAANLKQLVENATHRLKSISSPERTPEHKSKRLCDVSNSSNESVQSKEVSSFYSNKDYKENDSTASLNEAEEVEISPSDLPTPVVHSLTSESKNPKEQRSSRIGAGINQKIILVYFLLLITVVVVGLSIGLEYLCNGLSVRGYPWRWVSWDDIFDIFAPFVKRTYRRGPPPT